MSHRLLIPASKNFNSDIAIFIFESVTEQTRGVGENDILLPNGPTLVLWGVPHPVLGMPCLQPGDYLIKELYKLKSNDLMSSLRSPSPLEYPQTHSPSFPLCPVWATISQKQKQKSIVLLCPRYMVPKRPRMAAKPGFKSQRQSSSAAPFLTPPTIGHSCQHSRSKSRQVWPCGVEPIISKLSRRLCNQGELPPSYILG